MTPEPTTVASSNAVPKPSAAARRARLNFPALFASLIVRAF
jgi:hypothetical protein